MAKTSTKTIKTTRKALARKTGKAKATAQLPVKTQSKQAAVLALLRQQDGATIPEIIDATGWQPHSVRGFLSGALKKRLGIEVISDKGADGIRRYYVAPISS